MKHGARIAFGTIVALAIFTGSAIAMTGSNDPNSTPEAGLQWNQTYVATGTVTASLGVLSDSLEISERGWSNWIAEISRVRFMAASDETALGADFDLVTPAGDEVRGFNLVGPTEDGTITYSFRLDSPLEWLILAVGARADGTANQGAYAVAVERPTVSSWKISVDRTSVELTIPNSLESAQLSLDVSSSRPPWRTILAEFDVHDRTAGRLQGTLNFTTPE